MSELIIQIKDMRKAGHCVSGIRDFMKLHDLDMRTFVRQGLPVSAFDGIVDANLEEVKLIAQERAGKETK